MQLPIGRRWSAITALVLTIVLGLSGAAVLRARADARLVRADPATVMAQPALSRRALALGGHVFARHCAACHGADGRGSQILDAPDLAGPDHLYALDDVAAVEAIVRHGIRAGDTKGWNLASMPAFASAHPYRGEALPSLAPSQTEDLTQFLLAQTRRSKDAAAAARGGALFGDKAACWDCHGHGAQGDPSIGAPNLTDSVWLYGGDHDSIARSIQQGRAGMCPAFARRLSPAETRAVAVYAFALSHPQRGARHEG